MSWVKENKQRKKGKSGNMVSVFYSKNGDVILKPPLVCNFSIHDIFSHLFK